MRLSIFVENSYIFMRWLHHWWLHSFKVSIVFDFEPYWFFVTWWHFLSLLQRCCQIKPFYHLLAYLYLISDWTWTEWESLFKLDFLSSIDLFLLSNATGTKIHPIFWFEMAFSVSFNLSTFVFFLHESISIFV